MKVLSIKKAVTNKKIKIPFVESSVKAGFPSPADDYSDKRIDLNEELIKSPTSTFFVRVSGDSMKDSGILNGSTLVVDRSVAVSNGKIIVALLNGEFTVKRFHKDQSKILLIAENPEYETIEVSSEDDFEVWGVVIHSIHSF